MSNDNKSLGRFQLTDIPPAQRGVPQIEVTFDIDANGIMHISALYKGTGKKQSIKIEASSGLSAEEIEKMKAEAVANADADNKKKGEAELINKADSLIFQTERQISEYGDKLPADKKQQIEDALSALKIEFEAKNFENLEAAMEKLNTIFQEASQGMYDDTNSNDAPTGDSNDSNQQDEVTDVDFEEVVDDKK